MFGKARKAWAWGILVIPDFLLLYLALFAALVIRFGEWPDAIRWMAHIRVFSPVFILWLLVFFIHGLFEAKTLRRFGSLLFNAVSAMVVNVLIAIVYFYIQPNFVLTPRRVLLIDAVLTLGLIISWHIVIQALLKRRFTQGVFILSKTNELSDLVHEIRVNPYLGFVITEQLTPETLDTNAIPDNAVIVFPDGMAAQPSVLQKLYTLRTRGVTFTYHRDFYEDLLRRITLSELGEEWFLENIDYQHKRLYNLLKRTIDICAGLFGFIVYVISYPFFAALIVTTSPGSALFKQLRVGQHGRIFRVYKYRTMSGGVTDTWTIPNDPRITRVGRILRKLRIDELPQCINLLRGEMSLVGPRPEQVHIVEKLRSQIPFFDERHLVKPGITGWAQLNVYAGSLEETKLKLQYDLYYIKNRSLLFDLEIMLKTIYYIFTWSGR